MPKAVKTYINTRQYALGVVLTLVSLLGFGLMQVLVSVTRPEISVFEQSFFRNLVGLFAVIPLARAQGVPVFGRRDQQGPLFARSVSGFFAVLCLFYALRGASQADVTIVSRISMFTIMAASCFFYREKFTASHAFSLVLATAGALIAVNPRFDSSMLPLLGAFGNAMFTTVAFTLLSYFSGRVNPLTVVAHFGVFSTLASIPLMIPSFVMPTGQDLLCLTGIGFFAAVGQISMTYSYRMAPAGDINLYTQMSILVNACLGYCFMGQVPSMRTFWGGALTIAASFVLFFAKGRRAEKSA